jgi:tetratricopeptide (TPR) repeat protein
MFLKKIFRKDPEDFIRQGEKLLAEERYVDARHAFEEAQERLPSDATADSVGRIRSGLSRVGNMLGLANLQEAEHARNLGNYRKAEEHLILARNLAEDVAILEKAERLLVSLHESPPVVPASNQSASCSGCVKPHDISADISHVSDGDLHPEDRFEVLIHALPDDLPQRYASLGEKFACAYLLNHDGREEESLRIYEELLARGDNDIMLYEVALIHFKMGDPGRCEQFLTRAIEVNPRNSVCHLGMVQLLIDTGRLERSLDHLDLMIGSGILSAQSLLIKGEVLQLLDENDRALEVYSQALALPATAKGAAEKLIPLLESLGRSKEAELLYKRYMKGCC